jgi:hypothetical protein
LNGVDAIQSYLVLGEPMPTTIVQAFPTLARPLVSSILEAEQSIISGIVASKTAATSSQSTNGAKPTGNAMLGASAGIAAGFIGAVALL